MFATVAELEAFTDSTLDMVRAELALTLASSAIENVAKANHATIAQLEGDERLIDGSGTSVVNLPTWPVTAVTTVELDGTAVTGFSWSRNGVLERDSGVWTSGRRNVKVTATYGFAEPPTEIKAVTLQAASRAVLNPARLNSFSDGQVSVGFGGGGTGTQVLDLLSGERDIVLRAIR